MKNKRRKGGWCEILKWMNMCVEVRISQCILIYSTSRESPYLAFFRKRLDDESAQNAVVVIQGIGHS